MCVSDAPAGASFRVKRVTLEKEVGKRLADMGFTEGAEGAVVRRGFFRGPLHVRIRGYDLLIRVCEADGIEVDPVGDWSAARDSRESMDRGSRRHHAHERDPERRSGYDREHRAGRVHGRHGTGRSHGHDRKSGCGCDE